MKPEQEIRAESFREAAEICEEMRRQMEPDKSAHGHYTACIQPLRARAAAEQNEATIDPLMILHGGTDMPSQNSPGGLGIPQLNEAKEPGAVRSNQPQAESVPVRDDTAQAPSIQSAPEPAERELLPCPFCGGPMRYWKALWPSEGDADGIHHADTTEHCGVIEFSLGTSDEQVIAAWNHRSSALALDTQPNLDMNETLRYAKEMKLPTEFPLSEQPQDGVVEHEGFYEKLWKDFVSLQRGDAIGVCEKVERYYREIAAAPAVETVAEHPYAQMVRGNHTIGVFKDGKLIAADADVYAEPTPQSELADEPDHKALYHELLYQVSMKHPNETRHQTALRYLRNAERQDNTPSVSRAGRTE